MHGFSKLVICPLTHWEIFWKSLIILLQSGFNISMNPLVCATEESKGSKSFWKIFLKVLAPLSDSRGDCFLLILVLPPGTKIATTIAGFPFVVYTR